MTRPNMLTVVREAPPVAVARVEQLLDLLQPDRNTAFDHPGLNLFLLRMAEYSGVSWNAALDALASEGCPACGHHLHVAGDCLMAFVDDGGVDSYCLCGAPGAGPVVERFTDEVAQVQRELAERAWEHHHDAVRDAAAEADR